MTARGRAPCAGLDGNAVELWRTRMNFKSPRVRIPHSPPIFRLLGTGPLRRGHAARRSPRQSGEDEILLRCAWSRDRRDRAGVEPLAAMRADGDRLDDPSASRVFDFERRTAGRG